MMKKCLCDTEKERDRDGRNYLTISNVLNCPNFPTDLQNDEKVSVWYRERDRDGRNYPTVSNVHKFFFQTNQ